MMYYEIAAINFAGNEQLNYGVCYVENGKVKFSRRIAYNEALALIERLQNRKNAQVKIDINPLDQTITTIFLSGWSA